MTASLPRRSAAVTALALTAASGIALVAATPASAHVQHKARTSLSIQLQKPGVNPGGGDWISGHLSGHRHGLFDRKVTLQDKPAGATAWAVDKSNRTGKRGNVAFQVSPTVNTRYRMVFAGGDRYRGSRSGVVLVHSWVNATSLVETLGASVLPPGGSTTVNGTLSAKGTPIAGGTVILQSRTNSQKHFQKAGSGATMTDGTISFPVTPGVTTHYRLVFQKTAANGYARSATETAHVQQPSALQIGANENRKQTTVVITGRLHAGALGLAGRKLELQSSTSASPTFTTIGTQRTDRHGAVSFKLAAPTTSTTYQLVWVGGPNYAGSTSAGVTIS